MSDSSATERGRLLSTARVSEILAISTPIVLKLAREGELPAFQVGKRLRFCEADVESFLENARLPAAK